MLNRTLPGIVIILAILGVPSGVAVGTLFLSGCGGSQSLPPVVTKPATGVTNEPELIVTDPRVLSCSISQVPPSRVWVGEFYEHQMTLTCEHDFPLTYELQESPPGMTCHNGTIEWMPSQPGSYGVKIFVTDGCWHTSLAWTVQVRG